MTPRCPDCGRFMATDGVTHDRDNRGIVHTQHYWCDKCSRAQSASWRPATYDDAEAQPAD